MKIIILWLLCVFAITVDSMGEYFRNLNIFIVIYRIRFERLFKFSKPNKCDLLDSFHKKPMDFQS